MERPVEQQRESEASRQGSDDGWTLEGGTRNKEHAVQKESFVAKKPIQGEMGVVLLGRETPWQERAVYCA